MAKSGRSPAAMTKATRTALHLFSCLTLSVTAAVVLIKGAVYFDYQETLTLALPVLPSVFPIFYKVLSKGPTVGVLIEAPAHTSSWPRHGFPRFSAMHSLRTILIGVGLSLLVKYIAEALILYTLYHKSGLPFQVLFGEGDAGLLGRFLRGELLVAVHSSVMPLLAIELLLLTAAGGLWIGCTSSGSPALEGMLCGTIVAFLAALTNLTILYARIESLTQSATWIVAPRYSQAFAFAGPLLQILLYGCWAMAGQQWRKERLSRTVQAHGARRSRSR